MKIIIGTVVALAIICAGAVLSAQGKKRMTLAKYQPVVEFLNEDSTLSIWFKQYVDTTAGNRNFKDFLKKLGSSEVLWQRGRRAGLTQNQLYSPIVTLSEQNWADIDQMTDEERASVRIKMLELDIALAAVDATLPDTAHEEFRREVLRGAKPLTEVAKLPMSAVEAMTFTIMGQKLSDRINEAPPTKIPPNPPLPVDNPRLKNIYRTQ